MTSAMSKTEREDLQRLVRQREKVLKSATEQRRPREMWLPEKYSAARRALAEATKIDEVKDIHDKSIAMEVYAFQSKDAALMGYSIEIAERAAP